MEHVRWGIVGCGNVTEVKSGPGLQRARNSELVAVMRRNSALAEDYARRHGVPRWYDKAEDLINDAEVDAVYVATPPSSHHEYVLAAARAGKPVYVEKPMALTFAQCQEMIEACREAGVPLYVAYYRRALERFLKVKELLASGAIGEPRFVNLTLSQPLIQEAQSGEALPWRVDPAVAGGGLFLDLAAHMLDLLDDLLGPIVSASGAASNQAGRYRAEDIVTGAFVFESGAHGTGTWCFSAYDRLDRTEIVGSEGTIVYSTFDAQPITLTTRSGSTDYAFVDPPHIQQPLIQTIVDELCGTGTSLSTGESAARTSWVMDQLLRGYRELGTGDRGRPKT